MEALLIGRYAEIALKGGNRPAFEQALLSAGRFRLAGRARLRIVGSRLLATPEPGVPATEVVAALRHCFGLVSVQTAVALRRSAGMEEIAATAIDLARQAMAAGAGSFKVSARRADKTFALRSPEINRVLGDLIATRTGLPVDVHRPDFDLEVDVRSDAIYLAGPRAPGPGGLPSGTAGRGVVLLSGGIDSPVAAYLAAKRGLSLVAAYCHTFPYTGEGARQKVIDLCRSLAAYAGPIRLWVVHFTDIQLAIHQRTPEALRTVVARRMMVRLGEEIARREHAGALVTGDSLGQVASQTLESLAATGEVASLPLLRPLVAWDKTEIIDLARRIQTYDVSIRPYEDCCSLFAPRHPRTKPTRAEAAEAERDLDIASLVPSALEQSVRLRVTEDAVQPMERRGDSGA